MLEARCESAWGCHAQGSRALIDFPIPYHILVYNINYMDVLDIVLPSGFYCDTLNVSSIDFVVIDTDISLEFGKHFPR